MKSIPDLKLDEGALIEVNGETIAVYKSIDETLTSLSPICTHQGCIVDWNNSDKTWDCPCHGSRYEKDGTVKRGPAQTDLKKVVLP